MAAYLVELDLNTFPAWSGARSRLDEIKELGRVDEAEAWIGELLECMDDPTETTVNDILWFEMDDLLEEWGQEEACLVCDGTSIDDDGDYCPECYC